jgi:hypothetical protein
MRFMFLAALVGLCLLVAPVALSVSAEDASPRNETVVYKDRDGVWPVWKTNAPVIYRDV